MTETKMELTDWLDDLCVRFIINLPNEDLSSVARICFQVEEAQWYYEDFIRPLDPTLPSMSLRTFCMRIFQHCPLLSNFSATDHMGAFEEFLLYKTRVPVRGAILLNEAMDSVLLVKGWKKGANWSFPRGKINKDEDDLDCAVREVYEETGYDIKAAGLIPEFEQVKYIEMEMREQHMRLYVFRNIPEDTHFEPRTRKEISKIMWWKLSDLPAFRKKSKGHHHQDAGDHVATNANKFYMVAPFLRPLKTWVVEQKKKDARRTASGQYSAASLVADDTMTEEEPTPQEDLRPFYNEGRSASQYFPVQEGASADTDTMAKTTEALKRLLKIQPATQGVQSQMSSPIERSKSNKGADLLALLRGRSENLEISKSTALPLTPLELTFDTATLPKTPQHPPPPHPKLSSMAPPPSFPIPPTPIVYHDHPTRTSNQAARGPNVPHLHHPIHPQTHMQESRNHIQQLRHPQPLPPQVQKTLFDGTLAHSPAVAQFPNQASAPIRSEQSSHSILNPQFPNIHGPMVSEPKLNSAKLTQHSLSLLNAFKNGEKSTGPAAPISSRDLPLRTYSQDTIKPFDVKAPLAVPDNGRSTLSPPSGNNFALPSILSARAPPTEAHKSSLLDIFKQPGGKTNLVTTTSSSKTNVLAPSVSHKISVGHAHPPAESMLNPLKQQFSNDVTDTQNAHLATMPVHSQSSTTATSESSHTQPNMMNISPRQRPHRQDGRHMSTNHYKNNSISARNGQPSTPKVFQPQILKRPQQSPVSWSFAPLAPIQPSQTRSSSNVEAPKPTISSLLETRPPSLNTEQQQTLLALFSKKPNDRSPLFGSPSISTSQSGQAPDPRSRVSSSSGAPRRGSQTPMSPADQGFLLDYLEGVAKSHGR